MKGECIMEFWIFLLIMVLLIPTIMIGFGWLFFKNPPKEINPAFGYRTRRSMMNKETREFAHRYAGKMWCICGGILLPVSIVAMLFVLKKDSDTIGTACGIITLVQMLPLIGTIILTERALKRRFK